LPWTLRTDAKAYWEKCCSNFYRIFRQQKNGVAPQKPTVRVAIREKADVIAFAYASVYLTFSNIQLRGIRFFTQTGVNVRASISRFLKSLNEKEEKIVYVSVDHIFLQLIVTQG
jgi:hypothetical protein